MTSEEVKRQLPEAVEATPAFRAWFEDILQRVLIPGAKKIIEQKGQEQVPLLMVFGHRPGQVSLLPIESFTNYKDKNRVAFIQRGLAALTSITRAAIFVTETWTVSAGIENKDTIEGEIEEKYKGSLEHHPDRTETLMFSAMSGGEQLLAFIPINPGPPRRLGEMKPLVDPAAHGGSMRGRMVINEKIGKH